MLFPGPEIPQASKPELPEACPLVLAVTECANPAASNAGDVPSRQPSSDLMNGLDQLDTVLDGLLAEFDEASQGGLTLPAHNFGDLSGFANSNVELEVTDITGAYLDEMFDANGDIIVTVDTGAVPEGNMNPAITETDILGEVLLSPCGSVSGTLESMLNESVAGINNGDGETNSVSNVDTTMTEAHTMERTRSLANEDYLFAHILGIAAAETQVTEANFSPGIAENEGPSMAIADLGIEFEGGAALPIAMSNLQVEFMQIEQQINL
ncbi:hypothetical protein BC830DRAFT_1116985 [Chytriomyces sp. MP71]|nr:hypothetical protein BC830DRAFT_1116985 [Chytriomyces sp. MP71]